MADTFKGIITADGKKRTFAREGITPEYVSDKTLSIDGGFADAKATGDVVKSLKEDLKEKTNQYFINNFVRISRSENLLNYVTNIHDSEISTSNGSVITNTQGYCVSDYIPVGYDKKSCFFTF